MWIPDLPQLDGVEHLEKYVVDNQVGIYHGLCQDIGQTVDPLDTGTANMAQANLGESYPVCPLGDFIHKKQTAVRCVYLVT